MATQAVKNPFNSIWWLSANHRSAIRSRCYSISCDTAQHNIVHRKKYLLWHGDFDRKINTIGRTVNYGRSQSQQVNTTSCPIVLFDWQLDHELVTMVSLIDSYKSFSRRREHVFLTLLTIEFSQYFSFITLFVKFVA